MNFNYTDKELEGKITVFSSLGNQHFIINEVGVNKQHSG